MLTYSFGPFLLYSETTDCLLGHQAFCHEPQQAFKIRIGKSNRTLRQNESCKRDPKNLLVGPELL